MHARSIGLSLSMQQHLRIDRVGPPLWSFACYGCPIHQIPPFRRLPTRLMKKISGLTKSNGGRHCASRSPGLVLEQWLEASRY